ncbi:odorant receptor Or2-like [Cephus cinctus]|uniref:Odorant receptor Or2-like n=1 Tax=Cephus cinctus TaxID=211228 RepID=A0AAJ7RPA2_CEPCN|nr:odorant receptor Or2-like [Cephus cinctus]
MTDQARFISDAVYHSQWYDASQREKQSLRLTMRRAQRPLSVTASGFAVVSLELCTTIFSTSLSYFTLLRKVYYR